MSDRGNPDANDEPMVWLVIPDYGDDQPEPLIDPERVDAIMRDCMFRDDEVGPDVTEETLPPNAVLAEGILRRFALHGGRLETHRAEVTQMLQGLPNEFRDIEHGGGGGWSFLNACEDDNGVQWTGMHARMDTLFVLGIALGLVEWLLPREVWSALPGGMPYVVVKVAKA